MIEVTLSVDSMAVNSSSYRNRPFRLVSVNLQLTPWPRNPSESWEILASQGPWWSQMPQRRRRPRTILWPSALRLAGSSKFLFCCVFKGGSKLQRATVGKKFVCSKTWTTLYKEMEWSKAARYVVKEISKSLKALTHSPVRRCQMTFGQYWSHESDLLRSFSQQLQAQISSSSQSTWNNQGKLLPQLDQDPGHWLTPVQ